MKKTSLTLKLINAPYMKWAVLYILAPLIMVIYYAFTDRSGAFTLDNIKALSSYGAIFGKKLYTIPRITAPGVLISCAVGSPTAFKSEFIRPVFERIVIHEYVRIRKFIHMGSIMSVIMVR